MSYQAIIRQDTDWAPSGYLYYLENITGLFGALELY